MSLREHNYNNISMGENGMENGSLKEHNYYKLSEVLSMGKS